MFYRTTALLTRSFRVDARSAQSHFSRLLFVSMLLATLAFAHLESNLFGAPGLYVFQSICWLNFFFVTLAGIGLFATAISEEKEEETLGLLRMAGISPVSLLLGKSTTRLVSVLLMLVVQFPFVLLSITLGGVLMEHVFSAYMTLVAYLVLLANLGLACSVFCGNSRRAATLMTVILVLLLVIAPIASMAIHSWWASQDPASLNGFKRAILVVADWSETISIWNRIGASLSTTFADSLLSAQVIVHLLAAMILFGLSWAMFERCTRESHATSRIEKLLTGPIGMRRDNRVGRAWRLALTWKDFYFVAGGKTSIIVRLILYLVIIVGLTMLQRVGVQQSTKPLPYVLCVTAMDSMLLAAAIELALFASRVFREEVKSQALPLLAILPGTLEQFVWSKALAALPAMLPAAVWFAAGALIDPEDFRYGLDRVFTDSIGWCVIIWFILFLHLTAYLSLLIKWGALPLAIFLMYCAVIIMVAATTLLWTVVLRPTLPQPKQIWLLLPSIVVGAAAIVIFHNGIRKQLRALASR